MGSLEDSIRNLLLKTRLPLSIKEISDQMKRHSQYESITFQEIYASLLKLEKSNFVKRVYDNDFDLSDPIMTVKWKATEHEAEELIHVQMVASFPPRLGDFKQLCSRYAIRYFVEALEDVINAADNTLRIMCPFVDATLLHILIKADKIRRGLVAVKIISEKGKKGENVSLLNYIKSILRSVEVRYADFYEGDRKVFGIHAKAIAADEESLLLGSFNLTIRHIATNLDLGMLIKGPLVSKFTKIFDDLWKAIKGSNF
ncbi:MAG: phospholipase D family protein [Crenarchaeota archaeon]|nr:phospholipase D family protein [Thermoproteota archaeon]